MSEEKKETKPGMVNALSRILHLHQLPNQPAEKWPANAEPVIPIHAQNKPTVNASATMNPPIVSPARAAPATPITPRPAMAPTAASTPPITRPTTPIPASATISMRANPPAGTLPPKMAIPISPPATAKQSPWPFQAPWNASKSKNPGSLPASASARYPAATNPAPQSTSAPAPAAIPTKSTPLVRAPAASAASNAIPPTPVRAAASSPPAPIIPPAPMNMQSSISSAGNRIAGADSIITNYDRILDLVRLNQNMKLDDLTRAMQMDEERVAEELQTLEDNGLIEIRYPAFGEPIVHYKG